MGATIEDLADKIEGKSAFMAALLRDKANESLGKMCLAGLGEVFGVAAQVDAVFEAYDKAADSADKVRQAEVTVKKRISLALAPEADAACPPEGVIEKINADDYRSLKKINIYAKWTLSSLIVGGFFAVLLAQYFNASSIDGLPPQAKEQLALLVGALIAAFTSVVQYFFGSSVGSAEKTLMLQNKDQGAATPAKPAATS